MIEIDLKIKHHFSSGVYIKEMKLPKGHYAVTHKHTYDHFGILASGIAKIEIDGAEEIKRGPCVIEIKAGKEHKITSLFDVTWLCVHATEETDPDKVDEVLIQGES